MSVNYTAYTITGIRLGMADLYKQVDNRGCDHPETKAKFCKECGSPTWIQEEEPLFDEGTEVIGKFKMMFSTDRNFVYLGHTVEVDEYGTHDAFRPIESVEVQFPALIQLNDELAAVLEPLGLWDQEKFGIWTVLHCSY